MNPETIREIVEMIASISERVWEASIQNVYGTIATNILWIAILGAVIVLAPVMFNRMYKAAVARRLLQLDSNDYYARKPINSYYDWLESLDDGLIWVFFGFLIYIVTVVIFLNYIMWTVRALISPEWYAIQSIINLFPK